MTARGTSVSAPADGTVRAPSFRTLCVAVGMCLLSPVSVQAQTVAEPQAQPPIAGVLVLNQERLLSNSQFGQRIQEELETVSAALAAENRRIEGELTQEELDLTERRATLPPDEFRALADAFDARVEEIRATQEAKARDLTRQAEAMRAQFFERVAPILLDIVRRRGAAVLMDSRAVLLSAEQVDITDAALAAIDETIGRGGTEPLFDIDVAPQDPPQD
jgi:Skp family chaperone for outer membrane proteins